MPITLTITEDTLDELYATAARFAGSMPSERTVSIDVNDNGDLKAYIERAVGKPFDLVPAAPTGTSGDIPNIDADQDGEMDIAAGSDQTLDSAGIPWDERIHASTRTTKADGTWTRRRNTDDIYYASVMAELTEAARSVQVAASPVPPAPAHVDNTPAPPSVPAQPLAAPAAVAAPLPVPPVAAVPAEPATPEAPAVPVAAPVAAPAAATVASGDTENTMQSVQFMPIMAKAMSSGKLTNEIMAHYLGQFRPGLTQITQLLPDSVGLKQFYDWMKPTGLLD